MTMTSTQIEEMKRNRVLVLTKAETFWHYSIVPFLLITPLYTSIQVFRKYVLHNYHGRPIENLISIGYIWIVPAILFYFLQKHRLRFKEIPIALSGKEFYKIVGKVAEAFKWVVVYRSTNIMVLESGQSWKSWGERITILKDDGLILFNSICDPGNKPSALAWGVNKENRERFEEEIRKQYLFFSTKQKPSV